MKASPTRLQGLRRHLPTRSAVCLCTAASARSRSATTRVEPRSLASESRPARARCGGTPTSCRWRRPREGLPVGRSPLIRADRLAARAGPRVRALHQDRDVEPDPLVQGPGGRGRRRQGGRAGLRGAGLRVHRQPGRAPRPPPGPRSACRPTSSCPTIWSARRSSPRPPTAPPCSRSTAPTTTSTGCARSWPTTARGRS